MGNYEVDAPRASVPNHQARENMRTRILAALATLEHLLMWLALLIALACFAMFTFGGIRGWCPWYVGPSWLIPAAMVGFYLFLPADEQIRALSPPDARASGASAQDE